MQRPPQASTVGEHTIDIVRSAPCCALPQIKLSRCLQETAGAAKAADVWCHAESLN